MEAGAIVMEKQLLEIIQRLSEEGCRITQPRLAVLTILLHTEEPMRAEDIFAQVKNKRINLSSIYRSLHLLVAFGIAKKVNFHEDFTRYELSDQYRNHHHHLVCHACGKIEDYPDCDLETILQRVREEYGFETTAHDLELYGLCKGCQEEERK